MLRKLRERAQDEKGFTLIELLVVILIIGILAAIAIPSFLNQRNKGNDAESKSAATTTAQAMETCATDNNGSYATCNLAALIAIEPSLNDSSARTTVTSTATTYGITVSSTRTAAVTFSVNKAANGSTTRPCVVPAGTDRGGCPSAGTW